ncbi:hypothetical protein [Micromonospora lupini]|uniref:Uncharacterized protein n=1 Tax=Micromonospora lupini str. Lupac 08 TaxID=1150864 RepID=I0LBR0_9ACTN|nr:hypothetical protein [Micromonospora lupini]CCH21257.1 Conserved hypothetical protein [Micromonospora lupini str. Lupac 08]
MTEHFENLIRSTLTDLAEEAPIVHDQLSRAERRVRNRRRATVTVGAASTLAAILIATPIALAATGSDEPPPAVPSPAGPAVVPSPAVPTPSAPTAVPSPGGADANPSSPPGPPGVPGQPTVKPSPSSPPGDPGNPANPGNPGNPGAPGAPAVVPSPSGAPGVPGRPKS